MGIQGCSNMSWMLVCTRSTAAVGWPRHGATSATKAPRKAFNRTMLAHGQPAQAVGFVFPQLRLQHVNLYFNL